MRAVPTSMLLAVSIFSSFALVRQFRPADTLLLDPDAASKLKLRKLILELHLGYGDLF